MDNREIIQRSIDYIEENLRAEITAAELADMTGFSLFHYYRIFQQATGLPVMQYILRRRLLHGVYAMKQGSSKTDAVVKLSAEERRAIPYVILANQFVCVTWFAQQDKYAEIFETNKKMTAWLIDRFENLGEMV